MRRSRKESSQEIMETKELVFLFQSNFYVACRSSMLSLDLSNADESYYVENIIIPQTSNLVNAYWINLFR